jgi:BirA family biotin operon repressor/biotin-[acetyl-CoA-carboxylase] ligase
VTPLRIGRRIVRYGTIGSTMEEAARLAEAGEPDGTIIVTAEQTAGRGRAGRSWIAPPDSALLCSVLLRPPVAPDRLPVLSLVFGAAAAEAIEAATGLTCRLKWPNDLWLGSEDPGRKGGGVLLTSRLDRNGVGAVVAGIGINVTASPTELPPGATSLAAELGRAVGIEPLLGHLIERLNRGYDDFLATGGRPSLAAWRKRAALVGEMVVVTDGDQQHTGRFTGIDGDGRLLLEDEQGVTRRIVAGDLTRGPQLGRR